MRFSQRRGLTNVRVEIQRDSIDEVLRNKLWSALHVTLFNDDSDHNLRMAGINANSVAKRLWLHFFEQPVDTLPSYGWSDFQRYIREWFFEAEWYEIYDFIEALLDELNGSVKSSLIHLLNNFLQMEMSAFRIVEDRVAEITNAEEIAGIEDAIQQSDALAPVKAHLQDALAKLTDRKSPDFRNSIKESISAVEALCQRITGDRSASLGKALKRLSDAGVNLHPTLESAWSKLYGYTSDEGGIRHALSNEPKITFADAKYMLVTCSAFVSYLIDLSRENGVPLS